MGSGEAMGSSAVLQASGFRRWGQALPSKALQTSAHICPSVQLLCEDQLTQTVGWERWLLATPDSHIPKLAIQVRRVAVPLPGLSFLGRGSEGF